MNFDLSEEQQLLSDSVERFITINIPWISASSRYCQSRALAVNIGKYNLGWLGASIPEQYQGPGTQADTMVLMEQLGKGLVLEPFASAVLAASALKYGGNEAQQSQWLPQIAGSKQLSLAYAEQQGRFDLHDVLTRAEAGDQGFVLNGRKSMVLHAASADALIVSARTAGAQTGKIRHRVIRRRHPG